MKKKVSLLGLVSCLLVLIQIVVAITYRSNNTFALGSVKYATSVYENGGFYINAPWMSLVGLISKIVRIHPLILIHTVMPFIVIGLSYLAYYKLFDVIFDGDTKHKYIAYFVLCILNIYGYQSPKLAGITLLCGYFTGGCIIVHLILPCIGSALIKRARQSKPERVQEIDVHTDNIDDEEYLEEWDMKKHPILNIRNLAIALGVVVVMLLASVFVLNNKINKLYDATVNLQNQIESSIDAEN